MDDINFISNGIPGAGHYNPHVLNFLFRNLSLTWDLIEQTTSSSKQNMPKKKEKWQKKS